MTCQTKLRIMKTICWTGAVADALWTVALVWPLFFTVLTGRPEGEFDLTLRLTMGIGASLMAGWTLLLVWAAQNPVERRAVMLLTLCPVIAGLLVVTLTGIVSGSAGTSWILIKLILLGLGMFFGYHLATSMAREETHEIDH